MPFGVGQPSARQSSAARIVREHPFSARGPSSFCCGFSRGFWQSRWNVNELLSRAGFQSFRDKPMKGRQHERLLICFGLGDGVLNALFKAVGHGPTPFVVVVMKQG